MSSRFLRTSGRRVRGTTVAAVAVGALVLSGATATAVAVNGGFGRTTVGTSDARGVLLPSNQWVKPLGDRTLITDGRLLSSVLSPYGHQLAALTYLHGTGFLTVFDAVRGTVLQQVGTGSATDPVIGDGTVAADGPFYSADGKSLWVSQTTDLLRFSVRSDGTVSPKPAIIALSGPAGAYLPSGMTQSADHRTLYVALNGANTLGVIDIATDKLVRQIPVGVAPRQVALVGGRLFVSNEGGRTTTAADFTNLTDNTPVVADKVTGAATSGTVSVVDPTGVKPTRSIRVGLQPTALKVSGSTLFVANSNDDSVSIIDTATAAVTQTFNVAPLPGSTEGSNPNAIEMTDGNHLLVSIGRDNALAVYRYNGPTSPVQYLGLIPTDWYPVNVQVDHTTNKIVVTNDKGVGARGPETAIKQGPDQNVVVGHNTYNDTGSVTRFAPPTEADLADLTHQVFVNNDWQKLLAATPLTARTAAPVAVPATLGAPSTIKHVFLIIKENRTYDQILGDIGKGNSDPSLVQFGASVTPNLHAMANRYSLFDNFYDEGTLSADGHNWLMQADANDYIEKEFGAFYRSYPAQGGDALAYQRNGFLWNAAEKAGNKVAAFGEYANFQTLPATGAPTWADWYQASQVKEGKVAGPSPIADGQYPTYSDIPSLNAILDPAYPKFNLDIPDQYRADIWQQDFAKAEKSNSLANLNLLWVPDDHTSGISGTDPYPSAQVADNDLAVGRIVDTITHSKDWKDSAIFVLEDDSQAGADHVDGHRAPLYIVSPYAKKGVVNSTYYSQLNVVKTIEQMLDIAPMNQEDRAAEPMFDAFTNKADLQPFTALPNQIPLTYGLKVTTPTPTTAVKKGTPPPATSAATAIPANARTIAAQWQLWSTQQSFGGAKATEDVANPAQLNRLDWYTVTGWTKPYPGDKAVLGPYQVPGWDHPAAELGG